MTKRILVLITVLFAGRCLGDEGNIAFTRYQPGNSNQIEGPAVKLVGSITAHTSSGSVELGCHALTLITSSDFTGTITGASVTAGERYQFPVPPGSTLEEVAFTVSAGTLYSIEIR